MTLDKIDRLLKTVAGLCALLAGSTYAGLVPPTAAIILGFVAGALGYLAGSPLFDPTLVGKSPVLSRFLLTAAGLCGAAAGSTFFPQVQHMFADGTAAKIATALALTAAGCTYLAQSPVIAGGTKGAGGGAAVLALLLAFSACGGCGTTHISDVIPKVTDVAIDCAETATHNVAIGLIDDVQSALADGNWIGLLTDLAKRWGDSALDCAVHEVAGQANHNAMMAGDPLESTKAARGRQWLAARGRQ